MEETALYWFGKLELKTLRPNMYTETFKFKEYAGSGKLLRAALRQFDDTMLVNADIDSMEYKVVKLSDLTFVTGVVPSDAMKAAPVEWHRDENGYTFGWAAPGSLWPDAGEKYRIIVTFNTAPTYTPAPSASFVKVWQVETVDPESEET